jgi:phosphate uptake regulator
MNFNIATENVIIYDLSDLSDILVILNRLEVINDHVYNVAKNNVIYFLHVEVS